MAKMTRFLFLITAAALSARAADQTGARLDKAAAVFAKLTTAPHGIRKEQIDSADCIAVVPGFRKGAAVVGIGFGRGFISCRTDAGWSAPGAIAFETGSLGVQLGAEEIDICHAVDGQIASSEASYGPVRDWLGRRGGFG